MKKSVENLDSKSMEELSGGTICLIQASEKFAAIREIINKSRAFAEMQNKESFTEAVEIRERLESTGIGRGVAIAHGISPNISGVRVGLGISPRGIPFYGMDHHPVTILFVIAGNPRDKVSYLKVLAQVMKCIKQHKIREALMGQSISCQNISGEEDFEKFLYTMATQSFLNE